MEFKRSDSSRGPLHSSASRGAAKDSTPMRASTPKRSSSSARRRADPNAASPAAPLPPRTPARPDSARGATSSRGRAFERSASGTGSRNGRLPTPSSIASGDGNTFKRSNTAIGIQKAEKVKHRNRVNVYARVRDFAPGEEQHLAVRMCEETVEVNVPKKGKFTFSFDGVFWSNNRECPTGKEYSSQSDVFEEVGRPLVENALAGYNAAVMAYGQTGSGKTYTSFGPVGSLGTAEEGLIPRVCNMIFARAATSAAKGVRYTVSASMLEVYLEDVFDLLNHRKQLSVRNDFKNNSFHVVGAKSIAVHSYKDVLAVLNKAEPLRTFAATNIHDHSSRAHTLFMLEVQTHFDSADLAPRCARILLADLAGCERIKLAGTEEGIAFEQARNINLSLLALGSCIEAVATRGKNETRPIPEFRNSTLTKLLKDYLGGNSISTMMVTISPTTKDANLSVQTLRFADRAKQITTHAKVNTVTATQAVDDGRDISDRLRDEYLRKKEALYNEYQLQTVIEKLLPRIEALEAQLRDCEEGDLAHHLSMELEELQDKLAEADRQLAQAREILYGEYLMLEDELREMNAKMQEMRAEHEEAIEGLLGEETGRFEEMKRSYEQRMDVLSRTLADREEELGDRGDEIAELRRQVSELEEKLRAKEAECDELKRRLLELQETHDEESAKAAATITDREEQLDAVRGLLSQSEEEGAAQRKAAGLQRDAMNATIEALRADVARLEDDVAAKESRLQLTTSELGQQLEAQCAALVAAEQSHVAEREDLNSVIAELREHVAVKETAIQSLESNLEETSQALEKKGEVADTTAQTLQETQEQLQSTEQKLEETEEALREKGNEADNLTQDLTETKQKLEETEEALQDTSAKLEETEGRLQETEEALREKGSEADNLTQDLTETKQKLEETEEALLDTSAKLEETERTLGEEITGLEGCLAFSRKECEARDAYMADLLEYVRSSYSTTLEAVATQQRAALEDMMATSEFGLNDLSGSVAREAARFDMLRRVLGKIGDEVKTASSEVTVQERRQQLPASRTSALGDITSRGNSAPREKSVPEV